MLIMSLRFMFSWWLWPFLCLHQTSLLSFILLSISSPSLREWVLLFLRISMMWSWLHIWGKSPAFIAQEPFLLSPRSTRPTQAPSQCAASLPTELTAGKGNQKQEKLKTQRKFLAETHCTPHTGTVKHELFTWNAINRFSQEHKTLIVSWRCLHAVPEMFTLNLILQRRGKYPIWAHAQLDSAASIGYTSYTTIDYYLALLIGITFPF